MKKIFLPLIALIALLLNACSFSFNSETKEMKKQIEQLQKDVAELQKKNGITPSYQNTTESSDKSVSKTEKQDETETAAVSNKEERAMEAVKYCLKMYEPELEYTNIRTVPLSDGTVDVIIDYLWCGSTSHTYYNVTVYSDNEFRVNSSRGVEGNFPIHEKFSIK
ncbi:MAG: hypothetical protein K6A41_10915 [Bacteroidales bacterium]|nr:hypothetical protein [Bacteroidales bacterium]